MAKVECSKNTCRTSEETVYCESCYDAVEKEKKGLEREVESLREDNLGLENELDNLREKIKELEHKKEEAM